MRIFFNSFGIKKSSKKRGILSLILGLFGFGKKSSPKSTVKEKSSPREESPSKSTFSRKPERVAVSSPRLYVGNLSFDATESDLFELFSGIGQVQNVEIVAHRDTHRSKGFGFVQMTTTEEAQRAVEDLHDKDYMGRKLVVSGAKALPEVRQESAPAPAATLAPATEECCENKEESCCSLNEKTHHEDSCKEEKTPSCCSLEH